MIVFQRHAQLAGKAALDHRVFDDPEDQHLGDPAAPILWLHSERDQPRRPNPALIVKKLCEANRESVIR